MIDDVLELDALAVEHRPSDPEALRVAAFELRSRGLTDHDVASALRLSAAAVRQMLDGAA